MKVRKKSVEISESSQTESEITQRPEPTEAADEALSRSHGASKVRMEELAEMSISDCNESPSDVPKVLYAVAFLMDWLTVGGTSFDLDCGDARTFAGLIRRCGEIAGMEIAAAEDMGNLARKFERHINRVDSLAK